MLEPQQSCQGACTAMNLCCGNSTVQDCMSAGAKQSINGRTAFKLQVHTDSVMLELPVGKLSRSHASQESFDAAIGVQGSIIP